MKKVIIVPIVLLMLTGAVLLAGCTIQKSAPDIIPETTALDIHETEPADTVLEIPSESGSEPVQQSGQDSQTEKETGNSVWIMMEDEPDPCLKDRLTVTGVLGEDYAFLSGFGPRDSMGGQISSDHHGIDFAMDTGTMLTAPDDCIISYAGYDDKRGYWIVLYRGNGFYIIIQHLSEIYVETGDIVKRGEVVGLSGDTGASIMPHLHVEVLIDDTGRDTLTTYNENYVDPYDYIFGTAYAHS